MIHSHSTKRIVQAVASTLLFFSVLARADDCAGGADVTGNECNGAAAAPSISESNSRMVYLKGAAGMAEQKVIQAKQHQRIANDEVKATETLHKDALRAVSDAEKAETRTVTRE